MDKKNKQVTNKNYEVLEGQSIELLKQLHILTNTGQLNQDSRRKLKQVYHLYQFIKPLMEEAYQKKHNVSVVDHGSGKSYLGFILYDLFVNVEKKLATIYNIETRAELIQKSLELAKHSSFSNMKFLNTTITDSINHNDIPQKIDIVTALHACNTATDDVIDFGLYHKAQNIVLVPCCQAEIASILKKNRNLSSLEFAINKLWYHPIHAREFGSHLTNVLRILRLEAHGYSVTATELIGWEHSMKNELIIATKVRKENPQAQTQLAKLINKFGLEEIHDRFKPIA